MSTIREQAEQLYELIRPIKLVPVEQRIKAIEAALREQERATLEAASDVAYRNSDFETADALTAKAAKAREGGDGPNT